MTYVAAPEIPDVLASRYASPEMTSLWSPAYKVILERRLWIAVLQAQQDLGVDVPADAIEAYEAVVDDVDLDSIAARERVTRHDVKARIEEFNALAGQQQVHKGMTSRGPDRERRAAAGEGLARHRSGQGCGCPGAAGAHRQRASRSGDDRSLSQRRGTGHDPRQAVRQRCGGAPAWQSSGSRT